VKHLKFFNMVLPMTTAINCCYLPSEFTDNLCLLQLSAGEESEADLTVYNYPHFLGRHLMLYFISKRSCDWTRAQTGTRQSQRNRQKRKPSSLLLK